MGIFDNVSSIVINNKEVQNIVMTNNNAVLYEKEIVGGYHMTFGSIRYPVRDEHLYAGVYCTLTYDGSPVSYATINLTGDDGSSYTFTTDADGVALFLLYCKKKVLITYVATYDDYNAEFSVTSDVDTRLQINKPSCSKTTSGSGSSKKTILTWTIKDENGDNVPNISARGVYTYRSSSTSITYYTTSGTTNSNGQISRSWTTGANTYPQYSCSANGDSTHRPSVNGNWKYIPYTYS